MRLRYLLPERGGRGQPSTPIAGLVVVSVGAVLFMLGALRWVRVTRGRL